MLFSSNQNNMENSLNNIPTLKRSKTHDNRSCNNYHIIKFIEKYDKSDEKIRLFNLIQSLDLCYNKKSDFDLIYDSIKTNFSDLSSELRDKLAKIIYKKVETNIVSELKKLETENLYNIPEAFKLYTDFGLQPCNICYEDTIIYGIFDCGHVFCSECCTKLITCPTCRKLIAKTVFYIIDKPSLDSELEDRLNVLVTKKESEYLETREHNDSSIILTDLNDGQNQAEIKVTYGYQNINDKCNPCIINIFATNKISNDEQVNIAFLLDVSGSMTYSIAEVKLKLELYLRGLPVNSRISMHTFNSNYKLIFPITELNDGTLDLIIQKIRNIYASGGTNLANGLIGIKDYLESNTQVIIITDGATSNKANTINEFLMLRSSNPITLIGFGNEYSYANCIDIVNGDATVFEEALTPERLFTCMRGRINSGLSLVIEFNKDTNILYTTSKNTTGKTLEFINYNINYKYVLYNGLPKSIKINGQNLILNKDKSLYDEARIILYEFILNEYIKELANNMIYNPSIALKNKMLLKSIKNRIDSDKIFIGNDVYFRLFKFIETIHKSCCDILKQSNTLYSYGGIGRETTNSIARGVSDSMRLSSSST